MVNKYRVPGRFTNHIEHEDCADEHFLNFFKFLEDEKFFSSIPKSELYP